MDRDEKPKIAMNTIKQYDCFKLTKDLNPVIPKGTVGVILDSYPTGKDYEVEFPLKDGTNLEFNNQISFTVDQSYIEIIQ